MSKILAYMRKWAFDGETPQKERKGNGRLAWPFRFKLHPVTLNRCLADDIELVSKEEIDRLTRELAEAKARIAELEALVELYRKQGSEQDNRAWIAMSAECEARGEAIDRLRAEVAAQTAANAALRECLRECADDLEAEVNARALGELPRRIERDLEPVRRAAALLAQPAGEWVNPLAAEVEKLRAALVRARRGLAWASQQRPELIEDYEAVDTAIAARKGAKRDAQRGEGQT